MGFISRMLPISYSVSQVAQIKISQQISSDTIAAFKTRDIILDLPSEPVVVEQDPQLNNCLVPYSMTFADKDKILPFRRQKHLQVLMMANALKSGRSRVEREDFNKVVSMMPYINLDYQNVS